MREAMQLARLIECSPGGVTWRNIAEELECSRRTALRWMVAMETALPDVIVEPERVGHSTYATPRRLRARKEKA